MTEEMMVQLQTLLDKHAIEDQIKHYAYLIYSKQFDKMTEVLMEDAWIDYSASGGAKGSVSDMQAYLTQSMARFRSQHLMTNIETTIAPDRKTAHSDHILFNPMTMDWKGQEYTFFCGVRYHCDWVLCPDGVWRIHSMIQSPGYTFNAPFKVT